MYLGDQSSDVMLYDEVASGPMLVNQSLLLQTCTLTNGGITFQFMMVCDTGYL